MWRGACQRGIPVFMEKPFLLRDEIAHIEELRAATPRLMINFNRRFWPTYQSLRNRVHSGEIGTLKHAEFVLHVNIAKWCSVTQHRLYPSEGGALFDLGSQILDLARTIVGQEPVSLEAKIWKEFNKPIPGQVSTPNLHLSLMIFLTRQMKAPSRALAKVPGKPH